MFYIWGKIQFQNYMYILLKQYILGKFVWMVYYVYYIIVVLLNVFYLKFFEYILIGFCNYDLKFILICSFNKN